MTIRNNRRWHRKEGRCTVSDDTPSEAERSTPMRKPRYSSIRPVAPVVRRDFLKAVGTVSAVAASGIVVGIPALAEEKGEKKEPADVQTNIDDFMKVPKGPHALPGRFPGKVVQVTDSKCLVGEKVDAAVVAAMVEKGIRALTGKGMKKSFRMFFTPRDVVGIKINPVGAPLIESKPETVEAVIAWLEKNGIPRGNIVIWDRFDDMLKEAGYTAERFPGVRIEALQTMVEEGKSFRNEKGEHVSAANFDRDTYYFAKGVEGKGVQGYKDDEFYLNQHVFNSEYSYFGKLVSRELTKIVNIGPFKNTGHGISMATKNLGYGAVCNTGRLHAPLGFRVCTEVLAAPAIREKLVLNINDGIRGQYDDGPMMNEKFVYPHHTLYFATDPFALDSVCQAQMTEKRKAMGIKVSDHPRYTEYLEYAEKLGLGVVSSAHTVRT